MTYDLSNPLHRKQFVKRALKLLKRKCKVARLEDGSQRTLKQNSYLHVLCRILALEVGVSERYAFDVYFKQMANKDLFVTSKTDPITGEVVEDLKSSTDLTVEQMSRAIDSFRRWSEEQGYYLPEAHLSDDGIMSFPTNEDKQAYAQAVVETERARRYL